jgi:methyl-accepting chemotaxis protein
MQFLATMRIGRRLGLAFALVVTLTILVAAFIQWRLGEVDRRASELATVQAERTAIAYRWRSDIAVNATRALAVVAIADPAQVAALQARMKLTTAEINGLQKRFAELETTPAGLAVQAQLGDVRKRYLALRETMMKTREGTDGATADTVAAARKAFDAACDDYTKAADGLVDHQLARAREDAAAIGRALDATRQVGLVCAVVSVLLSIALGLLITRSIVAPIRTAQRAADRIAAGDLTGPCAGAGNDEISQLLGTLGGMQDALRRIVREIRVGTDSIHVTSTQVATGNQDLSERTEQTASSLQQAASSMDTLTGAMRVGADSAGQASVLAGGASEIARRGGSVVAQVVSMMDEINASSRRIGDITAVIDGIAFQTNILALNAAVEAARAGEQGRGFAVVAAEVRSLAQRSAEAAREIRSLIGASVEKVENGSRIVQDAGATMDEIVASVGRVGDVIGEISAAAGSQADGIRDVNDAVTQVDRMTQQNAALVEQSAAAAESMRDQASRLSQAVEQFRTE